MGAGRQGIGPLLIRSPQLSTGPAVLLPPWAASKVNAGKMLPTRKRPAQTTPPSHPPRHLLQGNLDPGCSHCFGFIRVESRGFRSTESGRQHRKESRSEFPAVTWGQSGKVGQLLKEESLGRSARPLCRPCLPMIAPSPSPEGAPFSLVLAPLALHPLTATTELVLPQI